MDIEMRILDEEVKVGRILKYALVWGIVVVFDGSLYISNSDFFARKDLQGRD